MIDSKLKYCFKILLVQDLSPTPTPFLPIYCSVQKLVSQGLMQVEMQARMSDWVQAATGFFFLHFCCCDSSSARGNFAMDPTKGVRETKRAILNRSAQRQVPFHFNGDYSQESVLKTAIRVTGFKSLVSNFPVFFTAICIQHWK